MKLALRFSAVSDVGRVRRDNQDSGYAGPHLLAVADGVGGAARGDVASSTAIQQLRSLDMPPGNDALEELDGAVHLTHNRLADLVAENPELDGTSTTVTAAIFDGTRLNLVHVGDSRGYLLRDHELQQLTKDHTFVQSLVDEGRITEDEARVHPHRNLILRAVDGVHEPDTDTSTIPLNPGDRLLFCSDGCCGVLTDDALATLLSTESVDAAAPALVDAALTAGSSDNVTVVVAEVIEVDDTPQVDIDETSAITQTPIVVGAAAHDGRPPSRSPLRRKRPTEVPVDPEALRYAPLPPRRFLWARRLGILVVVVIVLAAALIGGYRFTQTRYYVGADGRYVAIYRGVDWELPGLQLQHVISDSTLPLTTLSDFDRSQVVDGIPVNDRAAGEAKIADLVTRSCPPPVKVTTPPKKKTTKKKRGSTSTPTPSPAPKIPAGCPGAP